MRELLLTGSGACGAARAAEITVEPCDTAVPEIDYIYGFVNHVAFMVVLEELHIFSKSRQTVENVATFRADGVRAAGFEHQRCLNFFQEKHGRVLPIPLLEFPGVTLHAALTLFVIALSSGSPINECAISHEKIDWRSARSHRSLKDVGASQQRDGVVPAEALPHKRKPIRICDSHFNGFAGCGKYGGHEIVHR